MIYIWLTPFREAFNSSLAVLGVLLVRRMPLFSAELAGSSDADLRSLLDAAMGVLQDLDKGSKTVLRCRDTLSRLVAEFDLNGTRGKRNAHCHSALEQAANAGPWPTQTSGDHFGFRR